MDRGIIAAALARIQSLSIEVSGLRRTFDTTQLAVSDRQYLSRCFDLLEMELTALQQYLDGLPG